MFSVRTILLCVVACESWNNVKVFDYFNLSRILCVTLHLEHRCLSYKFYTEREFGDLDIDSRANSSVRELHLTDPYKVGRSGAVDM